MPLDLLLSLADCPADIDPLLSGLLVAATTPEGVLGYRGIHGPADFSPEELEWARHRLARCARSGSMYGYRHGVKHCLDAGLDREAIELLTDFGWLLERVRALPGSSGTRRILSDWKSVPPSPLSTSALVWRRFFEGKAAAFDVPDGSWPAYKILVQLAVEHADDSPITEAAERWLEQGNCSWRWLRRRDRPLRVPPDHCWAVVESPRQGTRGLLALPGRRCVTWGGKSLRVHDLADGTIVAEWTPGGVEIDQVLCLPGGVLAVRTKKAHTVTLWNPGTGEEIGSCVGHDGKIVGMEPLGSSRLVTWAADGTARVWCARSALQVRVIGTAADPVKNVVPLAQDCLVTFHAQELRAWFLDEGKSRSLDRRLSPLSGGVRADDSTVLIWAPPSFEWWDVRAGKIVFSFDAELHQSICYSHPWLLLRGSTGLGLVDVSTCKLIQFPCTRDAPYWDGIVTRKGLPVTWAFPDGRIRLWKSAGEEPAILTGHEGYIEGAVELPGGELLSWGDEGTLRLWDTEGAVCLAVLRGHGSGIAAAVGLSGDNLILSASIRGGLRLWDGRARGDVETDSARTIRDVYCALLTGPRRLATWGNGPSLRLWDLPELTLAATLDGATSRNTDVSVLPDGSLMTVGLEGCIRLWCPESGRRLRKLKGPESLVSHHVLLPGGRLLACHTNGTMRCWSLTSGECLTVFEGHELGRLGALCLDESSCVSWSDDTTLRTWDLATGTCTSVLRGHGKAVISAAALPGGYVISFSEDSSMRVWDPLEGRCLAVVGALDLRGGFNRTRERRATSLAADWKLELTRDSTGLGVTAVRETQKLFPWACAGTSRLRNGRLLAWVGPRVCVLHPETFDVLSTLEIPEHAISAALQLEDGDTLLWSIYGAVFRWDADKGTLVERLEGAEMFQRPEWLVLRDDMFWKDRGCSAWQTQRRGNWLASGRGDRAFLTAGKDEYLAYQSTSSLYPIHLDVEGRFYVSNAEEELFVLEPYHGKHRMRLDDTLKSSGA